MHCFAGNADRATVEGPSGDFSAVHEAAGKHFHICWRRAVPAFESRRTRRGYRMQINGLGPSTALGLTSSGKEISPPRSAQADGALYKVSSPKLSRSSATTFPPLR